MSRGLCSPVEDKTILKELISLPKIRIDDVEIWKLILSYVPHPVVNRNLLMSCPQFFGPLLEKRLLTNPCFTNLVGIDHDIHDPTHVCWKTDPSAEEFQEAVESVAVMLSEKNIESSSILSQFLLGYGSLTFQKPANQDYWVPMLNDFRFILDTCGTQIHHFRFKLLWNDNLEWPSNYLLLHEFLNKMPNLRTLELCGFIGKIGKLGCSSVVKMYPLPDLDNLVVLKVTDFPAVVTNALILKYGPKLEKLSVGIKPWDRENFMYANKPLTLANRLTELALPLMTSAVDVHLFLAHVDWPTSLKGLSASIQLEPSLSDDQGLIFKELSIQLLKRFSSVHRITTLNLQIVSYQGQTIPSSLKAKKTTFIPSNIRLALPFLKRLWLYVSCVSFSSIDFILGLKDSLEELVVNSQWAAPDWSGGVRPGKYVIDFVKFQHRMQDSNIWSIMPKLMKVSIRRTDDYNDRDFPRECFNYVRHEMSSSQDEFLISRQYFVLDKVEKLRLLNSSAESGRDGEGTSTEEKKENEQIVYFYRKLSPTTSQS